VLDDVLVSREAQSAEHDANRNVLTHHRDLHADALGPGRKKTSSRKRER
jgi:hypothetical protein